MWPGIAPQSLHRRTDPKYAVRLSCEPHWQMLSGTSAVWSETILKKKCYRKLSLEIFQVAYPQLVLHLHSTTMSCEYQCQISYSQWSWWIVQCSSLYPSNTTWNWNWQGCQNISMILDRTDPTYLTLYSNWNIGNILTECYLCPSDTIS